MITGFKNPPVANRPRPFWFFNGDMNRDEVRRQVIEMKDKGLGGFFLCARQGLRIPYLSQEWFDICNYTVEVAKENGLEVWLYDEYPYPSGVSGGEVLLQCPHAKQQVLKLFTIDVKDGGAVNESLGFSTIISALAYPVKDGVIDWASPENIAPHAGLLQNQELYQKTQGGPAYKHSVKRYFTYGPSRELRWQAPAGDWHVVVAFEHELEDFKYYGSFLDPANPDAVQSFLDTTYETYKNALGEDFGATVKGMFGDETSFLGAWPWSHEFDPYFEEKYGYRLSDKMTALTNASYPDAMRVRYNYYQCIHELLRDRYHKVLGEWCEKNDIAYVTEVPSGRMSNQMYSHVPGGDPCHDKLGFPYEEVIQRDFQVIRQNPKTISAMTRQFNRRDSLIESFHSIGWSMTLQDAKWQIDRQTLMGISLHNFHAYYYTVNGITKHDAPPSQFLQNPYWEYYNLFADYCGHSSRFITETDASTRVAVLHPPIMWSTHLRNPFHRFGYTGTCPTEEARGQQLVDDWKYLCKSLIFNQIEYDDLDSEVMAMGKIENGVISVGKAKYDTLVVPPFTNMEKYAFDMIREFQKSGGKVVFVGVTPFESIETGVDPLKAFADYGCLSECEYYGKKGAASTETGAGFALIHTPGGLINANAEKEIAKAVKAFAPDKIDIIMAEEFYRAVIVHRREDNDSSFVMLASQNGVYADTKAIFRDCPANAAFYELNLENGEVYTIDAEKTADGYSVDVALTPWSARVIAMTTKAVDVTPRAAGKQMKLELCLDNAMDVSIAGKNVYRLEELAVSIDGAPAVKSLPNTFIEHFKASNEIKASQIGFSDGFGTPTNISVNYPIPASYSYSVEIERGAIGKNDSVWLLRDRMAIMGGHTITINGKNLPESAFEPVHVYDVNNICADIADYLKAGANSIVVNVTATEDWHGVSDPMYLLGDFGVVASGGKFVIAKTPAAAKPVATTVEGFPFYSGKFIFEGTLTAGDPAGYDSFEIELPESYRIYECVELEVNGEKLGARAFSPYCWSGSASLLKKGENSIRLTIANTLINMLEGSYFDYEQGMALTIKP